MTEITVIFPDRLARALGETPESRAQRLLENAAVEEYRAGHLSHRELGEILGLDYWQAEEFLKGRNVPISYSRAEFEADQKALDSVLNDQ